MAIEDIDQLYEKYIESDKYRAFLFTPADLFAGELDLIEPRLSLRKDGFDILEFKLATRLFDLNTLDLEENSFIDFTLDGYYIIFEFGDLNAENPDDIQKRRFIIKDRQSSLENDQATHFYSAISSEYELNKLPIINWPGVVLKQYLDINGQDPNSLDINNQDPSSPRVHRNPIPAVEEVGGVSNPKLLNQSTGVDNIYQPIKLKYTPKDGKILVFRVHKEDAYLEPLFETSFIKSDTDENFLENMPLKEYHYDRESNEIIAWIPAHMSLPDDAFGSVAFREITKEKYEFFIFYEPEQEINTDEEDEDTDIVKGEFEKAYDFEVDGLTINEILKDLFETIEDEEGSLQYFVRWQYDEEESYKSQETRSNLNFSNTNVYEMLKQLEENYQVYINFDTVTRKIKIEEKFFGTNNGLRFEYGKYLTGVSQELNTDDLVTYLQGQDANNIGFADVSWSGDNYIENYDYYLDGVTFTPEGGLVGVSRWMSLELALVLAQIKYYQDFYEDEVWGNELEGAAKRKGLANIRFKLQEKLNEIDTDILEIESEILLNNSLIDNYHSGDQNSRNVLDTGAQRTKSNIVKGIVEGKTFTVPLQETLTNDFKSVTIQLKAINAGAQVRFKSFNLQSTNFFTRPITVGDGAYRKTTEISDSISITNIKIQFRNGAQLVKTVFLTMADINKEISLNGEIVATTFDIEVSIKNTVDPENKFTEKEVILNNMVFFEELHIKDIENVYDWDTYPKYIDALTLDLQAKITDLQIKQNAIRYGREINFNPEKKIDELKIFGVATNESEAIGIGQLELRLKEIQTYTAIDHESLEDDFPEVLDELKAFRKGGVYANIDIRDSRTLFIAARDELQEKIFPTITIDISSVSILQTYEGFEDWNKVRIGEKVDISVPQLRMNIEAEIIELDMEFQNYSTSIKISTVRNYDKSFGKIFSNIFLLAGKTSRNDVNTKAADNEATKGIVEAKENQLGQLGGGAKAGSGSNGVFDNLELSNNTFIALGTNTLTNQIPAYYDQTKTRGVAQITNGGIYVRDFSNNMRIKINSSEGFVGLDKFGAETFRVDLDGFSSISMNQFTRGYDEDGIFLGSTKTDPIPDVLTVNTPGSTTAISIAPSTGDKFFFKSGVFFSQSLKIGDLVRFTNDNSVMYGFIKTFYTSSPNHIEVKVTKVIGTTAYASWTMDIGDSKFSIVNPNGNGLKWDGKLLDVVGTITATAGDIGGWKIQGDINNAPGIFSGFAPLANNIFGSPGQLTISSEGYIAGNNFKITKEGSAEFTDLKAKANVDLGNIKKLTTVTNISRSGTVGVTLNGATQPFPGIYTQIVTSITGLTTRLANFITVRTLFETPQASPQSFKYRFLLFNGLTFVGETDRISRLNNQTPDFTNITLLNATTFNRIDIQVEHSASSIFGTFNFTHNILSSSSTTVVIEDLRDPVLARDAVNLQHLQNNYNIVTSTTGVAISGGEIQDQRTIQKQIGPNGTDMIIEYFIRATITTSLGEAVLTLPSALPNAFILVSPYRNSADGSGVDVFYGFQTNNSVYRVRHDFASSSNNTSFVAHIIGYDVAP